MSGGDGGRPGTLDPESAAKADPKLRQALAEAAADDLLGVVLVLAGPADGGSGDPVAPPEPPEPPDPADFADRVAWRQAMIDHHKGRVDDELGDIRDALAALGLRVQGGTFSAAAVVEGPPPAIRAALALPGVRHASLDHEHRRGSDAAPPAEDG